MTPTVLLTTRPPPDLVARLAAPRGCVDNMRVPDGAPRLTPAQSLLETAATG